MPLSTVVREQRRLGLNHLSRLDPPRPAHRYEWPAAGDLLHLDIKKLGKIGRVGHRINGDRTTRVRGIGWEAAHVAIDDCTRLGYAEVLPDESQGTTAGFLTRAIRYFARRGIPVTRIMTDNGSAYRSRVFAAVVTQHQLRHLRTRPYTPPTNGKAERFIRTLLAEGAYAQAYRTSLARTLALSHYLGYYNTARPHMGIRGQTPQQRLAATVNNLLNQQHLAEGGRGQRTSIPRFRFQSMGKPATCEFGGGHGAKEIATQNMIERMVA